MKLTAVYIAQQAAVFNWNLFIPGPARQRGLIGMQIAEISSLQAAD